MAIKFSFLTFILLLFTTVAYCQDDDVYMIRKIHDQALSNGKAYHWLTDLCGKHGTRIAGSPQYIGAAEYTKKMLATIPNVNSYHQACEASYWKRGDKEIVEIRTKKGEKQTLNALSLGNSVATPAKGIFAEVIEVQSLDEVESLGKEKIAGKNIFYNRPMDPTKIRTFNAYGGAVDQRVYGASKAAEFGAVAVLVRSMTTSLDDVPHTGVTIYKDDIPKVPGIGISTNDAEMLSAKLKLNTVKVFLKTNCRTIGMRSAPTVIGEIKGSEFPDEIIIVGGHLDSWDIGEGAHDDGAGVMQSIEVIRVLKTLNLKPKRTVRAVLFANEENGLRGAYAYLNEAKAKKENHLFALESDAGGFTPRSFGFDTTPGRFKKIMVWQSLFVPYGVTEFLDNGGGADVDPLKSIGATVAGFNPDSQRYFDIHHNKNDVFENVSERELKLGAANMAALIYLVSKYGL